MYAIIQASGRQMKVTPGGFALLEGTLRLAGCNELAVPVGLLWCTAHGFGVTRTADHRAEKILVSVKSAH